MTLKKFASAGMLALATAGALAAAGPAVAGGPAPHPYFGPDIVSPTSLDGNGIGNNLLTLNLCGNNLLNGGLIGLELTPILSPDIATCEEVGNRDNIEVEKTKKFGHHD